MKFNYLKLAIVIVVASGVIAFLAWLIPVYKVWSAEKDGQAQLAHAKYSKEVLVADALAQKESAEHLADRDTIRAHGIARSNQIIGESLKDNPGYLTWLWIDQISKNQNEIIYVPTEANIPIMEATRFMNRKKDSTLVK